MTPTIHTLLDQYVDELKARGCIRSVAVERAFRTVERHRLVERFYRTDDWGAEPPVPVDVDPSDPDPLVLELIYSDRALVTRVQEGRVPTSSTSQPCLVALMLEALALKKGLSVLEIGAGTGYNAALMAEIVSDPALITTLDIQEDVVAQTRRLLTQAGYEKINVLARDGFFGSPEHAPFDRIVATVGCPDLSPHWAEQLAPDGLMLIPLQHGGVRNNPLMRLCREQGRIVGRIVDWSGFMTIQGELYISELWDTASWWTVSEEAPACQEYPLFPGFPSIAGDSCQAPDYRARFDLHYFMALCDRRAFWGGAGLGLWDESAGAVVITRDRIQLYGLEKLYHDLAALYEQWERLGQPSAADFRSEFLLNAKPLARPRGPRTRDEKTWEIERKFFTQRVELA